jgi:hypothetical protein
MKHCKLIKKFSAFHGNQRFVAVTHKSDTGPHPMSYLCLGLLSHVPFKLKKVRISRLPHACYMLHPSHSPFDYPNNT